MPKKFPTPRIEQLMAMLAPTLEELRSTLAVSSDLEVKFVTGPTAPPALLVRLCGTLPAAEEWHDEGPAGLAIHSLRVATKSAFLFRKHYPEPSIGTPEHLIWTRRLLGVYLAGLIHDLGKLWFIDVQAAGLAWPIQRYLCDWVSETLKNGATVPDISIGFRPRSRNGPCGHEPLSLYMLPRVLPPGLVPFLGFQVANDILAATCFTLGASPSDAAFSLAHEADTMCTGEERLKRKRATTSVALRLTNYTPGSGTIADDFVHGFRRVAATDQRVKFNTLDGHVLVSPTHTVLWLTSADGRSIFRTVYDLMRTESHRLNLGGFVKSFYESSDPGLYLEELAERRLTDGESWCVPAIGANAPPGEPSPLGKDRILHHVVVTDANGRKQRKGFALILRNDALWGDMPNAQHGVFSGRIAAFSKNRKSETCDPEEIGFSPMLSLGRNPSQSRPSRVSSVVHSSSADGILDLPTVSAAIVGVIDQLGVDVGDPEQQRAWAELISAVGDRLTDASVLPALELCLDRLRHIRVRGHSTAMGSQSAPRPPASEPLPSASTGPVSTVEPTADDLTAVVAGLVHAIRSAPLAEHLQDPFHAYRYADGSHALPWPQVLDGVIDPERAMSVRERGPAIARQLGVDFKQVQIPGISYGEVRPHHQALIVPATWSMPRQRLQISNVDLVVLGG